MHCVLIKSTQNICIYKYVPFSVSSMKKQYELMHIH